MACVVLNPVSVTGLVRYRYEVLTSTSICIGGLSGQLLPNARLELPPETLSIAPALARKHANPTGWETALAWQITCYS